MNTERARAIVGGVFLGYRAEIVERLRTDVPVQVFEVRTEVDAPGFPGGSIVVASGRRDASLMRSLLAAGEAGDAATARRTPGSAPTRAANPAGRRLGVQTSIGRGTSHAAGAAVRVGGDEAWCGLARPQPAASRQPASNSATIDRIHTPDDMSLSRLLSQAIGLAAQIVSPWATPASG